MAKYFIVGEAGSKDLWLINLEERRIEPFTEAALESFEGADASFIRTVNKARSHGIAMIKGVDVAIASDNRNEASAMMLIDE
ncbi:hypothetical protein HQ945_04840 [Phyllobacterium sp. BT25]|uniref:Uncharacterized protein n=1 Tax=Phyllobacterium pellucidum TaxID=2740464 RepID=A0A849VNF6_9HYPH|nr:MULTISPECIES: hypothetical protein [Phyllobacterium]NTS30574.1 hypothetical protein [Phyllobacterium pellucidum]SFI60249.1 hypothetical protein SAMN04515648_0712 [Phyllobacterium sp. CL33Tsu]